MKPPQVEYMYVWRDAVAMPILGQVFEHTWVTSYTPGGGEPDQRLGYYWYCWGQAHITATQLNVGVGGLKFARNIAKPNDPLADVGIRHRIDGVCHQMVNRLVRFSRDDDGNSITVNGAKGYQLSKPMYGEYGGKDLPGRTSKCMARWNALVAAYSKATEGSNDE